MDLATLVGIVGGVVMVVFGIISSGGTAAIPNFVDVPSVIITIGGSLIATLGSNKLPDFLAGLKAISLAIKETAKDPAEVISQIINMSNLSRKEGLLALEEASNEIDDDFLKKGIMLVVDGTDPELVRGILETELDGVERRHKTAIGIWEKWAEMGPAWGMIGTLVGLVNMLKKLDDMSMIGPNMAVALLTTLYGSLIANWLAGPTAAKLKVNNDREIIQRQMVVEGLLSIQAGENPRVIEEKLKAFLSPADRAKMAESGGEANG